MNIHTSVTSIYLFPTDHTEGGGSRSIRVAVAPPPHPTVAPLFLNPVQE